MGKSSAPLHEGFRASGKSSAPLQAIFLAFLTLYTPDNSSGKDIGDARRGCPDVFFADIQRLANHSLFGNRQAAPAKNYAGLQNNDAPCSKAQKDEGAKYRNIELSINF